MEITEGVARKVLETVDAGLVRGIGKPKPGQMCVEAAVCYAMGLPHGDEPSCVSPAIRALKIRLNDSAWSSNEARAQGMRRLALVQLGSAGAVDDEAFAKAVAKLAIQQCLPVALRAAASVQKDQKHVEALLKAAKVCEEKGTKSAAANAADAAANAANAAYAAANAAYAAANAAAAYAAANAANAANAAYADAAAANAADAAANAAYAAANAAYAKKQARDTELGRFAEAVVQILVQMKAPGCQWLYLTE
jgi:hypothetical protein